MSKVISFTYEKANGVKSHRVLAVSLEPNRFFAGTDISELNCADQVMYVQALETFKAEYLADIAALNEEFDLKTNYRQFDPSRMTNVIEEDI